MARVFQVEAKTGPQKGRPGQLGWLWIAFLILMSFLGAKAADEPKETEKKKKVEAAKMSVTGYGLFGNRELKRVLRTVELNERKPQFFGASFIEDSALLLTARVKRDGYLVPSLVVRMQLEDGKTLEVRGADLLENPLPRPLRIKRVQFRIHKGVLYHFEKLDIDGLESMDVKQARSYFVPTETLLHLRTARVFTPDRLKHGISSLTDVLDRQGYEQAVVEADRVVQDEKNGNVDIHIQVRQGPKFMVRTVREDFYYGTNQVAQSNVIVRIDKPYSRLWQQDFALSLKTNQFRFGFPDTTVKLDTVERREEGKQVNLNLLARVDSHDQIRIGNVAFRGQKRTHASLLSRRVRVERGELLDPVKVEEGRARLSRLGVFQSVDLEYQEHGENTRDVIYNLAEGKRINVSLLFGWGSYEMLRGGVELEAFNLWGLAHNVEVRAIQSFKASSGSFTYTIPELVGKDIDLFLNASGLRREEVSFTRIEYGGGLGLHKYFVPEATDVSVRYNYQILDAEQFGSFEAVASDGLTNPAVGSIMFEVKHDRRDNPLYPTKGYKVFATVETATEYLGGDANYERVEISPSWHKQLGGGRTLSLGFSHGFVYTFGSPANNLPFNRRFFPGGENSIRGFTEGEASPRNEFGQIVGAETYTLGTVELEQALTPKWSLVVFSDNLGMARRIANYPWDTGLFSIGGGLRWRTLIGPIRLEYGYNINPRPGDPSGTLQFSLGFPF